MKKLLRLLIFSTSISIFSLSAIGQKFSTPIKVQAMEMAKALIRNDFTTFSKYMHPNVIEFAGGKEKMKDKMDSANVGMKRFGVAFKKILIGNPGQVISYKNALQCVVPQTTTMKTPLGEFAAETSLIAISTDKGKNWYFIDTNVYKVGKLKSILPDLSPELVIPPQKQPKSVTENDK